MTHGVDELRSIEAAADVNQFDYRPVPMLAPVTLFLGMVSAVGLLTVIGLFIALLGTILGTVAFVQIRRARGELGGIVVTSIGLVCAVAFLVGGTTLHAYTYATEVPENHLRVNFNHDISKKGFVEKDGRRTLHPDVAALEGEQIFVKGFMWNTSKPTGLSEFLLLKDNGECCFGGDPSPTDMIIVRMQKGMTVDAMPNRLVAVGGVLRCKPDAAPMEPVYFLDATHCELARTSF
jgi:hypothetical protein